jgi:FkbM family methyltransferase
MGLRQFTNSVHQIVVNPHVSTPRGLVRHVEWQVRKALNLFPFEQRLSGSRIVAAHRTCSVSALIHNQGLYDYNNMKLVQLVLQDGGVFFDIGANIGSYTLLASEQHKAAVVAFEPHPDTFQLLSKNVQLNHRQNVTLLNVALGEYERVAWLTDQRGGATNHFARYQGDRTIAVRCQRADAICSERQIVPQVVKLDVEGFEYDVLTGFGSYLQTIELLLIEMNGLSDRRSHGQVSIDHLLRAHGLKGPFRCDVDRHTLLPVADRGPEDSLYLSDALGRRLLEKGWRVELPT